MIELPVREGWDENRLLNSIAAEKDVDGLSACSLGELIQSNASHGTITPATPQACIALAEVCGPLAGKNVVVVGRGKTVGKPLANMLIALGATVQVCHSRTVELRQVMRRAEVVFLATGKGRSFDSSYFADGQIIVDAGISSVGGNISGDADVSDLEKLDVSLTPVPGGVGPLTSLFIFNYLARLMRLS